MFLYQRHPGIRALLTVAATRGFQTTSSLRAAESYYNLLGISKSSTQTEIKAAYYKLSMLYHPDKNQGCENAAIKFREITQAYEVLGNYRLRRLYDKGIIHTPAGGTQAATSQNIRDEPMHEEDDAETKFYKSRFTKSQVADAKGRRPIYDFDEWSRAHYGKSFDRRQTAKKKYDRMTNQKIDSVKTKQNDIVLLGFLFGAVAVYLIFMAESSYDTPKERALSRHAERLRLENEAMMRRESSSSESK